MFFIQSSLDLSEFAKAAKKKLQSVRHFSILTCCSVVGKLNQTLCSVSFQLSNHQFEELAMDVYDEVDRRETDAGKTRCLWRLLCPKFNVYLIHMVYFSVWLATQNHSTLVTDTTVVPFLPVNPEYSSTRNQVSDCTGDAPAQTCCVNPALICCFVFSCVSQGRQKLARFSAHEFATLVIDILTDAKRRQWGNSCDSPKGNVPQFYFY